MSKIESENQQINKFLHNKLDIDLPFDLCLEHTGETNPANYHCVQLLNVLPKKRLVLKAVKGGISVLIKFFPPSAKGKRQYYRELAGHALSIDVDISIPELITSYEVLNEYYAVVYQYLENGEPFSKPVFRNSANHITSLYKMIGSMHANGIYQRDAHLDNIMVSKNDFYLIDFGSVKSVSKGKPLNKELSLNNLAKLISNFPDSEQSQPIALLESYYKFRNWQWSEYEATPFVKKVNIAINKRNTKNYKAFKNLTGYQIGMVILILGLLFLLILNAR